MLPILILFETSVGCYGWSFSDKKRSTIRIRLQDVGHCNSNMGCTLLKDAGSK